MALQTLLRIALLGGLAALLDPGAAARAQTVLRVPDDHASIQGALDAASPGDEIRVAAGIYVEDLDFGGLAVRVVGSGPDTVIEGTGSGPVVRFVSGETPAAVLDSVRVSGGQAESGGGILVRGSSPTVVRTIVAYNAASQRGSGIAIEGPGAAPRIFNNLIAYNTHTAGDPHAIEVVDAAPFLVNNTLVRGDSNAVILRGASPARLRNNIFARNGSRVGRRLRGRGICDFSAGGVASIQYNLFHRNRIAALLGGGRDWRRIRRFQRKNPEVTRIADNLDGLPGFVRGPKRKPAAQDLSDLALRTKGRSKARDAGDPADACRDLDGSPNDIGHTGGPFAAPSTELPAPGGCGIPTPSID